MALWKNRVTTSRCRPAFWCLELKLTATSALLHSNKNWNSASAACMTLKRNICGSNQFEKWKKLRKWDKLNHCFFILSGERKTKSWTVSCSDHNKVTNKWGFLFWKKSCKHHLCSKSFTKPCSCAMIFVRWSHFLPVIIQCVLAGGNKFNQLAGCVHNKVVFFTSFSNTTWNMLLVVLFWLLQPFFWTPHEGTGRTYSQGDESQVYDALRCCLWRDKWLHGFQCAENWWRNLSLWVDWSFDLCLLRTHWQTKQSSLQKGETTDFWFLIFYIKYEKRVKPDFLWQRPHPLPFAAFFFSHYCWSISAAVGKRQLKFPENLLSPTQVSWCSVLFCLHLSSVKTINEPIFNFFDRLYSGTAGRYWLKIQLFRVASTTSQSLMVSNQSKCSVKWHWPKEDGLWFFPVLFAWDFRNMFEHKPVFIQQITTLCFN